jgi:hypothetical protein
MLKIGIYGPCLDMVALGELIKHIPVGSKEVVIQAPARRAIDLRACMRPGWLEYSASVDNKVFIHLAQEGEGKALSIKVC